MSKINDDIKEKESRKRRRLFIMILLVILLITSFGVSTYAWFSSNKHATIDSIDINVATVTGIQVSVDAINWDNKVTKEQIMNAYKTYRGAENQLPDTLTNMSTSGNVSQGKMDMFLGLTEEEKAGFFTLTTRKESEKQCSGDKECGDKHFIAFDIFLLVTTPVNLSLTTNSNVIPQPGAEDKGSQNAARVGFVVEGTVGATESLAAQNLKRGNSSLIWEPNYDVHTEHGVIAARNIYGITTSRSGGSRLPYKGVNTAFNTPVALDRTDESSYFTTVNPKVATTKDFSTEQPLMAIPAGITKVRIYMWLEGQDVDLENNASDTKLQYNVELAMMD